MSSKLPSNEERKFKDNADSIQALLEGGMSISEAINKAMDEADEDCDDVGGGLNIIQWAVGKDFKKLDEKVRKLLKVDFKCAMKRFDRAMIHLEHDDHHGAYKELKKALDLAERAFFLIDEDKFKQKVHCKWILCYSRISTCSYDSDNKEFRPFSTLTDNKQRLIANLIFDEINALMQAFEKMKKEEQDSMDELLKVMLPFMWPHVERLKNRDNSILSFNTNKLMEYIDAMRCKPEG